MDPSLPNPPGNKEFRNFYSKCADDNKASKCRTFASYSSLLQQFKCSPPLKQIALPWSLTRLLLVAENFIMPCLWQAKWGWKCVLAEWQSVTTGLQPWLAVLTPFPRALRNLWERLNFRSESVAGMVQICKLRRAKYNCFTLLVILLYRISFKKCKISCFVKCEKAVTSVQACLLH